MTRANNKKEKGTSGELLQFRFGGEAGQGVILAGVMWAEFAAAKGFEVGQSARYGAAVRGGTATADIVISDSSIDYPHVERPDFLIVLSQSTYDQFAGLQSESSVVIYDPFFVSPNDVAGVRQVAIPGTETAIREFGKGTAANFIMLGALSVLSNAIERQTMIDLVNSSGSPKFRAANVKAIDLGIEMIRAVEEDGQ